MTIKITVTALLASLLLATPAHAEEAQPAAPAEAKPGEAATKEEVKTLTEEIRRLKLEMGLKDVEYKQYGGLGPAASKVYFAPKGLSFGGYGEIVYANQLQAGGEDFTDLYRVVLYTGYRFNDRIVFNSEVEFEHHSELGVEFAYLDFLLTPAVQLRIGNMLVPVGIANELHEPPFFNGVFRPQIERNLIPSTWNENGAGLHGEIAGISYKAYLLTGLNIGNGEGLSASSWIRGSRTGGGESPALTFGGVAAVEYDVGPATVGGSFYSGRGDQDALTEGGEEIDARVNLFDVHALGQWRGLSFKALYTMGWLDDADLLSVAAEETIGSRVQGWYAELGYDVMTLIAPGGEQSLTPFFRYEQMDLHDQVPAGFTRDPGRDLTFLTAGLTYKPLPTVALKADWVRTDPKAGESTDQVDLGIGFVF